MSEYCIIYLLGSYPGIFPLLITIVKHFCKANYLVKIMNTIQSTSRLLCEMKNILPIRHLKAQVYLGEQDGGRRHRDFRRSAIESAISRHSWLYYPYARRNRDCVQVSRRQIDGDDLPEWRDFVFKVSVGMYDEQMEAIGLTSVRTRLELKQRRGDTANDKCASDIVDMVLYVCGLKNIIQVMFVVLVAPMLTWIRIRIIQQNALQMTMRLPWSLRDVMSIIVNLRICGSTYWM